MGSRSMTADGSPTTSRWRWSSAALRIVAVVLAMSAFAPRALAQSPDELRAARELFQEAFKDEQEKRYPEALEKFQRVAKVKESASVRYRIATVLVAMGRLREARDMYRALASARASLPPSDQETADSAAEKAAELDRQIPKLALRVQDDPPPDVRVTIDGAPVSVGTTPRAIEVDPGVHVVAATARGSTSPEHTVTLAEGAGEVPHTVTFVADKSAGAAPSKNHTLAWIAVGGGAAFLATGVALLVVREDTIGDINRACPGNVCPSSRRADVESDRDQAHLLGPLGGAFALVGLAAIGTGVYLLVRSPPAARATTHVVTPTIGGMRLALTF
jgi:hypothetical protein